MKQLVDLKQANDLYDLGITYKGVFDNYINTDSEYYYYKIDDSIPAPTIGELIEWIWDKTNLLVEITNSTSAKGTVSVQWSCGMDYEYEGFELIDALVELAIKIKEQAE